MWIILYSGKEKKPFIVRKDAICGVLCYDKGGRKYASDASAVFLSRAGAIYVNEEYEDILKLLGVTPDEIQTTP